MSEVERLQPSVMPRSFPSCRCRNLTLFQSFGQLSRSAFQWRFCAFFDHWTAAHSKNEPDPWRPSGNAFLRQKANCVKWRRSRTLQETGTAVGGWLEKIHSATSSVAETHVHRHYMNEMEVVYSKSRFLSFAFSCPNRDNGPTLECPKLTRCCFCSGSANHSHRKSPAQAGRTS
jgi:hypothetical protein